MKFDSYHPAINFIYFLCAIGFAIWFNHPVFLGISYVVAFAYSIKLNGVRALVFNLCLIPIIILYAAWYSYYTHFGVTELRQNFAGNSITLEALVYGLVIGITIATVIMWMSCVFAVISSDKVVYLFGRISPRLSLFMSIMLRSIPRIKETAHKINTAQRGIGKGLTSGITGPVRIASIVVTWTLENFIESSQSMKNRGYSLRGRTAFSIYRFDNRDRSFVIAVFTCLVFMMMAIMLNQVSIIYNPEIIMNRITWVSFIFYGVYAFFLLLPMGLQVVGEARYTIDK